MNEIQKPVLFYRVLGVVLLVVFPLLSLIAWIVEKEGNRYFTMKQAVELVWKDWCWEFWRIETHD